MQHKCNSSFCATDWAITYYLVTLSCHAWLQNPLASEWLIGIDGEGVRAGHAKVIHDLNLSSRKWHFVHLHILVSHYL